MERVYIPSTRRRKGDFYYYLAKKEGYRSRAAYKLEQIDEKFHIFNHNQKLILDLCGAPGGWSQVIHKKVPQATKILLIDLARVTLKDLNNVTCLQCDITNQEIIEEVKKVMESSIPKLEKVDVVLSDCAPKVGGNYATDQARQIYLAMHAFRVATLFHADIFLAKCFDGTDFSDFKDLVKQGYENIRLYKPPATRSESAEIYVIAKDVINTYVPPPDF